MTIPEIKEHQENGENYMVAGISVKDLLNGSGKKDFYGGSAEPDILELLKDKWVPWGLYQTSFALSESLPTKPYASFGGNGDGGKRIESFEDEIDCIGDNDYEQCLERISIDKNGKRITKTKKYVVQNTPISKPETTKSKSKTKTKKRKSSR